MEQFRGIQCWFCANFHFLKPLPDETFTYCPAWGETIKDIDLRVGYSKSIQRFGRDEEPCSRYEPGSSPCETTKDKPFDIPLVRQQGEERLLRRMKAA